MPAVLSPGFAERVERRFGERRFAGVRPKVHRRGLDDLCTRERGPLNTHPSSRKRKPSCHATRSSSHRSIPRPLSPPRPGRQFSALAGYNHLVHPLGSLRHVGLLDTSRVWHDDVAVGAHADDWSLDETVDWWSIALVPIQGGLNVRQARLPRSDRARLRRGHAEHCLGREWNMSIFVARSLSNLSVDLPASSGSATTCSSAKRARSCEVKLAVWGLYRYAVWPTSQPIVSCIAGQTAAYIDSIRPLAWLWIPILLLQHYRSLWIQIDRIST